MSHAIFRVARLHKAFAGQLLRRTGLYPGQELLLMRLWDEGPQRQVDLVRSLGADAPSIARTVQRLERAGYVRRRPDPGDRRSALVEATPASRNLRREIQQIWAELESLTVGDMSKAAQAEAVDVLEAIEHNLKSVESQMLAPIEEP